MAKYKAAERCFINGKLVDEGATVVAEFDKGKEPKHLKPIEEAKKAKK